MVEKIYKAIDAHSLIFEGVDDCDFPDFPNARIVGGFYQDDTMIPPEDIEELNNKNFLLSKIILDNHLWVD